MSTSRPSAQRGASLLEVLIAVVVLSLGLLGMAGLQMTSLRNNQSAMERSMAVFASYSIADAIRVDRASAQSGAFDLALDADPAGESFASSELTKWRTRLQAELGEAATGGVACAAGLCTITVQWDDQRGTDGDAQQQIVTEVRL